MKIGKVKFGAVSRIIKKNIYPERAIRVIIGEVKANKNIIEAFVL